MMNITYENCSNFAHTPNHALCNMHQTHKLKNDIHIAVLTNSLHTLFYKNHSELAEVGWFLAISRFPPKMILKRFSSFLMTSVKFVHVQINVSILKICTIIRESIQMHILGNISHNCIVWSGKSLAFSALLSILPINKTFYFV